MCVARWILAVALDSCGHLVFLTVSRALVKVWRRHRNSCGFSRLSAYGGVIARLSPFLLSYSWVAAYMWVPISDDVVRGDRGAKGVGQSARTALRVGRSA